MIWISTKPCITHVEGINAYMNKCAYKYTYICICDSLIIGKFGSLLYFGKIECFTRFVAYPITKIMFHSWDQTSQLNCKPHYEYTTAKPVLSSLFRYKKKKTLLICQLLAWKKKHTHTLLRHFYLTPWVPELELELFLQPTVSRPVSLGIGPPFGTLDQILSCSSFFRLTITLFFFLGAFSDEKTGL
jgi:hypothetical protein